MKTETLGLDCWIGLVRIGDNCWVRRLVATLNTSQLSRPVSTQLKPHHEMSRREKNLSDNGSVYMDWTNTGSNATFNKNAKCHMCAYLRPQIKKLILSLKIASVMSASLLCVRDHPSCIFSHGLQLNTVQ